MNHLSLFFLLKEIEKTTAESKTHEAVTGLPVSLSSQVLQCSFPTEKDPFSVSTEKAHLSFKLLLGDLFTTYQSGEPHRAVFRDHLAQ